MKKTLLCVIFAAAALGCNKDTADAGAGGAGAGASGTETGQAPPSNVNNPAVMSEPPASAAPGQSIRIQPSNPNDPKYQADPKLAGGG